VEHDRQAALQRGDGGEGLRVGEMYGPRRDQHGFPHDGISDTGSTQQVAQDVHRTTVDDHE
jgi:hypothetical protein